jgi:6-pyruvoyltetrahydropterin/6-carboxytetrahydropterin synthase
MVYRSTKTWGHERGFSCCFRQAAATHSHCSLLHGYSLSFKFTFESDTLDVRNWVVDFGGLDDLKSDLSYYFDHTLAVAADDPALEHFYALHDAKLADIRVLPAVGCEAFARLAWGLASLNLEINGITHARVISCEVAEHAGNSAIYFAD